MHTLAYKGMNIFVGFDANLPTQLWIAGRYLEAVTLVIAPLMIWRKVQPYREFAIYAAVSLVLMITILTTNIFPVCFIEGVGLTPFKIYSEYIICILLVVAGFLLYRYRESFERDIFYLLIASIGFTIVSELSFTFYIDVYGFSNLVGHLCKIVSFALVYKALVESGIRRPFDLIFRNLSKNEEALRESEAKFRMMSDWTHDWEYWLTHNRDVVYCSPSVERITGYSAEEFMADKNLIDRIIHPDDRALWEEHIPLHTEDDLSENAAELEFRIVTKDGATRWIGHVCRAIFADDGTWAGRRISNRDITDRKLAEEAQRASEIRYRRLFEAAQDGILILDAETGKIVDVNPFLVELLGFSQEQFLGKSIWEIGILSDIIANKDNLEELQRKKYIRYEDLPLETADGRQIAVEFVSNVYTVDNKEVIQCNIRDITERKKAEEQLLLKNNVFESSTTANSIADKQGLITHVNPAFLRLWGYRNQDEVIGKSVSGFFVDETVGASVLHALELTGRWEGEFIGKRVDGSTFISQGIATVIKDKNGEFIGYQSANLDITDRKKAERELQKLASIVQHSGEIISLATPDGKIIFMNEAGARMLGTTPEEAVTHPRLYFIPEHLKEKVESELLPLWMEQDSWEGDLQYINNSTGKPFDVHTLIFKIKDPATGELRYLANVSQDITKRKKAENALQEVNKKLNLLSSITRHDIINQVTGAEMILEVMEMEGDIPPDSKTGKDLKIVTDSLKMIERQIVFTRDYQDLGVKAPNWQKVGRLIDETGSTISNGLTVQNEVGTLEIYADPLFEKVIYNLFDNAIRYGEKITTIRFTSEESPEGFKLICEDDGVGVPADAKEKIFNRQYFQHTGLGLFLSKEILSITGMTIAETGEPGVGARFEILVPEGMWRLG